MQRYFYFMVILLSTCFFLFMNGSTLAYAQEKQQTYELKFQCHYPDRHYTVQNVFFPWIKRVAEMSGGRLQIVFFPPGAIVKENETFNSVKVGAVDIGTATQGRNPGKFPLSEITELPFLFPTSEIGSVVMWSLFERYPEWQKEYEGVKLLWHWTSALAQLASSKKPIESLSDLKGLKVIGWTPGLLDVPKILGANPVNIPPMDTYMALERGMADAVHTAYAAMVPFKLAEATKYVSHVNTMVVPFYGIMNLDKFNSLPDDLQHILIETTGKALSQQSGQAMDKGAEVDLGILKKQGLKQIILSDQELEKWIQATMPLREAWLAKMESKGYKTIREMLSTVINLTDEMSGDKKR